MRTIALATAAIFLLAAGMATAEEVTRDSYAAQVEPICKVNTKANERILKGVRTKVQQGKLAAASTQFAKAATALKATYAELKAVPQPAADSAKLGKWLGYVKSEADLFKATSEKLAANQTAAAQAMVVQLTHIANLANTQVLGFDFEYCRFEPSKFS
jgi:hypothetical protein